MKTTTILLLLLCGIARAGDIYVPENHHGNRVYGLPTPTTVDDAATKQYVDTHVPVGGTPSPTPSKTPAPTLSWYGNPTNVPADPIFNQTSLPGVLIPAFTGDVTKPDGSTVLTVASVKPPAMPPFTGDVTTTAGSTVTTLANVPAAALPAFTGDVTKPAASTVTTLTNIPDGTTLSGGLIVTNRTPPPAPPATGTTYLYVDAASKNWAVKNDVGAVTHSVQSKAKTPNSYIEAILDNGASVVSQPFFPNIGGNIAISQMNGGIGATATTAWYGDGSWKAVPTPTPITTLSGTTITASTISTTRINQRVSLQPGSSSNLTPNCDTDDLFVVQYLTVNATINTPTGTPVNGQQLVFRIKDNGVSQKITWAAGYRVQPGVPITTTPTNTYYVTFRWNSFDNYWDQVQVTSLTNGPSPTLLLPTQQPAKTPPRPTPKQTPK